MTTVRFPISDFQLANPLYTAAQVTFFTVDASGHATATLATLYADPVSSTTAANPQTLDGTGKFSAPVYIATPVIASVVGPNVGSHVTGVIDARGTWKGNWVTATVYFSNDFVVDPATQNLYVSALDYTSGATIAIDIAAGHLVLVLNAATLPTMSSANRATFAYTPVTYDLASNLLSVDHLYTTTGVTVPVNSNYSDIRMSQPGGGNNTFTVGASGVASSIYVSPEALVGSSASSNLYGAVLHATNDGPGTVRGAHLAGFATAGSTGSISAAAAQIQPVATSSGAWGIFASLTSSGVNDIAVAYGIESSGDRYALGVGSTVAAVSYNVAAYRAWMATGSAANARAFQVLNNAGTEVGYIDKIGGYTGPNATINPVASSLGTGLTVNQTPAGAATSISVQANNVFGFNSITIADGSSNAASGGFSDALLINYSFGGATTLGGHQGIDVFATLTTATSGSNTNKQYVAGRFAAGATVNDGGTNTGAGALGSVFGINPVGTLGASATNFAAVTAMEANVGVAAGGTVKYKSGIMVVQATGDAVQGALYDCAIGLSNQSGTPNWSNLFLIGNMNGQFPLTSGGSIMSSVNGGTLTNGLDLTGLTFSGTMFKGQALGAGAFALLQNSAGNATLFQVDNAGNVFTKQLQVGGSGSGTTTVVAQATASGTLTLPNGPATVATWDQIGFIRVKLAGVNFNAANTDTAVTIPLPPGVTRYVVQGVRLSNASASISTATIGVFTATGGGGQTIAANQAITVTQSATDTNNNTMQLNLTNTATEAYNDATLQVRVGTAQGSAATADVILIIVPLS